MTERLQKKIFDEESKPVQWNKELVWTKINRGGSVQKKFPIYRIAAATAFILILAYYGSHLASKSGIAEAVVDKKQPDPLPEITTDAAAIPPQERQAFSSVLKKHVRGQRQSEPVSPLVDSTHVASEIDTAVLPLTFLATMAEDTVQILDADTEQPETRKIQAIIGIVPDENGRVQVTAVKKGIVRVDLFNIEEGKAEQSFHETKSITARIK